MIVRSGRAVQEVVRKLCPRCGVETEYLCYSVRYKDSESNSPCLTKISLWTCAICDNQHEQTGEVMVPNDRARIIARLFKLQEDYDIRCIKVESAHDGLRVQISVE